MLAVYAQPRDWVERPSTLARKLMSGAVTTAQAVDVGAERMRVAAKCTRQNQPMYACKGCCEQRSKLCSGQERFHSRS